MGVKAKVTLIGCLSYRLGNHRFIRNKPVIVEDSQLLSEIKNSGSFAIEELVKDLYVPPVPEDKKEDVKKFRGRPRMSAKPSYMPEENNAKKTSAVSGTDADLY